VIGVFHSVISRPIRGPRISAHISGKYKIPSSRPSAGNVKDNKKNVITPTRLFERHDVSRGGFIANGVNAHIHGAYKKAYGCSCIIS
jgi:hypothetical protein